MTGEDLLNEFIDAFEAKEAAERLRRQKQADEPFIPWAEVRKRLRCKPEVWARILRLNDHRGLKAYSYPRGYHPKRGRPINQDVVGPQEFIARFGRAAYRNFPKNLIHHDGHRKLISAQAIMEFNP